MFQLSQMGGFLTLLAVSVVAFALMSAFGHGDGEISDHDGISSGENGPSLLSLRNLFLFGVGFGAAGSIATHLGYSLIGSSLIGFVFGCVVALIGFWFYRTISQQQATTNTDTRNLVGKRATVTTRIPTGRMGQVSTEDEHGGTIYLNAHTEGDLSFEQGVSVVIAEATGNTVVVSRPIPHTAT